MLFCEVEYTVLEDYVQFCLERDFGSYPNS